jgi:superfamily II DNA or RNA helicase
LRTERSAKLTQTSGENPGSLDGVRSHPSSTSDNAFSHPQTDWARAEDLFEAFTARVGIPGCTLWPHQASAIIRVRDAYADGARRIMLQLPTGGGKTRIAGTITRSVCDIGRPVVFVVPALELVDQTLTKFFAEGVTDVGIIQADHRMTSRDRQVQIASVQTLMRRELPPADLVFVDEAHRWFDFYRHWMLEPAWADVPFIGLSATPWTKGLGAYYDKLIIAATTEKLIDAGILSDFKVFAPAHPDLNGVRTVAGDYHEGDLGNAMDRPPLVADIVETWLKHGVGRPTLCFAVNRAHADHIRQRFEEAGVRAGYVDCYTEAPERAEIRRKFASGEYQVVCNVGVLTIGVDWDVRCIILARPTKSEILYTQIIGRGLRTAEGKDHCLILDHSDTTLRLGFVTEIHHENLHDGKTRGYHKRDAIKLPKACPRCAYLRPPSTPECPNCGFVAAPVNKVRHAEGELHELTRDKTLILDPATLAERQRRFYAELAFIGRDRGYKRGWVAHKFNEKFGCWPLGLGNVTPMPPSDATLRWVKSRQIAWAKSRARTAP